MRILKVGLVVLAMLGSASVGAYIAAHSDVLAPQVGDGGPGTGAPPGSTTPPAPVVVRWDGHLNSTTSHALYVGGTCHTNWNANFVLLVDQGGGVTGKGTAQAAGKPGCDFATSQIPIRSIVFHAKGELTGGAFALHLIEVRHTPAVGANDLGGFVATVLGTGARSTLRIPVNGMKATARIALHRVGSDRDTFTSINRLDLSCVNC